MKTYKTIKQLEREFKKYKLKDWNKQFIFNNEIYTFQKEYNYNLTNVYFFIYESKTNILKITITEIEIIKEEIKTTILNKPS